MEVHTPWRIRAGGRPRSGRERTGPCVQIPL